MIINENEVVHQDIQKSMVYNSKPDEPFECPKSIGSYFTKLKDKVQEETAEDINEQIFHYKLIQG